MTQSEVETGPAAWFAFEPQLAAVPFDDPFDDRETHTGASTALVLPVQSAEQLENLALVVGRNADAVVADHDGLLGVPPAGVRSVSTRISTVRSP